MEGGVSKVGVVTFSHGLMRLAERFAAEWKESRRQEPDNYPAYMTPQEWWGQWEVWCDSQGED